MKTWRVVGIMIVLVGIVSAMGAWLYMLVSLASKAHTLLDLIEQCAPNCFN